MKTAAFLLGLLLCVCPASPSPQQPSPALERNGSARSDLERELVRKLLRIQELGDPGAPRMSDAQEREFEILVRSLSESPLKRFLWAWLEFRLRNERALRLEGNPKAPAIRQRIELFQRLLRRYFLYE